MMQYIKFKHILFSSVLFVSLFIYSISTHAHCDTLDGPVAETAREALDAEDVTPLLKWVSSQDEQMIRVAFQKTINVRNLDGNVRDLVDMYFFETLVHIHRAGEGASYTGLKPGKAVDPAVALADQALEIKSVDKLINVLTGAMAQGIRQRYQRALVARKRADETVIVGREYVDAYVNFTRYVK
jgi:hypothetical protein